MSAFCRYEQISAGSPGNTATVLLADACAGRHSPPATEHLAHADGAFGVGTDTAVSLPCPSGPHIFRRCLRRRVNNMRPSGRLLFTIFAFRNHSGGKNQAAHTLVFLHMVLSIALRNNMYFSSLNFLLMPFRGKM